MNKNVDADFLALPLAAVSDAAISTAKDAGASVSYTHLTLPTKRIV